MGIVGRYIDALSDEQRDRVIQAEDFYCETYNFVLDGVGCLVGVAEMDLDALADRPLHFAMMNESGDAPAYRFPRLCKRFGKDRIVALCKERAAKGNRLHEIRSEVYRELVPEGGINGRHPEHTR